jgi:hypothetical protein
MVKVYIESRDNKRYELSIHEFIKSTKLFCNGLVPKNEVLKMLDSSFDDIYKQAKHSGKELNAMVLETQPRGFEYRYSKDNKVDYAVLDLMQQFITFYAEKLNDVLCQKALNKKWIKATGNPVYSDINLYGFIKESDSIIIKSFIFATLPKNDELYVSSTCGTGGTSTLFQHLKDLVKDKSFYEEAYQKIKYIHLESIEKSNTINFYSKIGFYKTNKDTNKVLKYMINVIYNKSFSTFDDFVRKASKEIGGSLYWTADEKVKKKLKIEYVYEPELWYKNISKFRDDGMKKADILNHFYSKYHELKGAGIPKDNYALHAVIIKKPFDLDKAKEEAKQFIKDKEYFRETSTSYRFRNIPKQRFVKSKYRTKKVNDKISLIYGKLKE